MARNVLGTLLIDIKADTAKAVKGVDTLNKRMSNAATAAGRAATTIASAFAGGAIIAGLADLSRALDDAAKSARKLGVDSVANLEALQFVAAETAGVMSNQFNTALQRSQRRIAEASLGMGEAQKALELLGLSAKELTTLAPEKSFLRLADAIKDVENPAQRLALTVKLFDSEGADLVNTLALGSDGIREMEKEFNSLNSTLTDKNIKSIEQMNDAFFEMKVAFRGLGRQILSELADPLTTFFRFVANDAIPLLRDLFNGFKLAGAGLKSLFVLITSGDLERAAEISNKALNDMAASILNINTAASNLTAAGDTPLTITVTGSADKVKEINQEILEDTKQTASAWAEVWGRTLDRFASGMGDAVADVIFKQQSLADAARSLAQSVSRQVISSLVEIGVKQLILAAQAKASITSVAATQTAAAGTVAAASAPAAAGVSLFTGGANAPGALAGIAAVIAAAGAIAIAGSRATGGNVQGGKAFSVGERGREIFIPNSDGFIVPNGGMGGSVNPTIVINKAPGESAERAVIRMRPIIENWAQNVFLKMRTENRRSAF